MHVIYYALYNIMHTTHIGDACDPCSVLYNKHVSYTDLDYCDYMELACEFLGMRQPPNFNTFFSYGDSLTAFNKH
jgi:hypothetical protein